MLKSFVVSVIGACVLFAGAAQAAGTAANPATKTIEHFYSVLTQAMKDGPKLGIEGRYKMLKPAVEATFNLPVMTEFAVGPSWSSMSNTDHKALIDAFERMTISNYAKNFDSYGGQTFVVDPQVIARGPDKFVQTTMQPKSGEPVKFNYRMRDAGNGDWKVIDVLLAGFTSQLALRRSEFAHTVDTEGATGLVKKINKVADNAMKG